MNIINPTILNNEYENRKNKIFTSFYNLNHLFNLNTTFPIKTCIYQFFYFFYFAQCNENI